MKSSIYILVVIVAFFLTFGFVESAHAGNLHVKVKKGDTLWHLAKKYYGKGHKFQRIAKANGIKNPRLIFPGQWVIIPNKETGKKFGKSKKIFSKKLQEQYVEPILMQPIIVEIKKQLPAPPARYPSRENHDVTDVVLSRQEDNLIGVQENIKKDELAKNTNGAVVLNKSDVPKKEMEAEKHETEFLMSAFFGCPDILSQCSGGKSSFDIYRKIDGAPNHSMGVHGEMFGATGRVMEIRYVWHKLTGGLGIDYKYETKENRFNFNNSLLIQSLNSEMFNFERSQQDVLSSVSVNWSHLLKNNWSIGIGAEGRVPIFTTFVSEMPRDRKSNQSQAELEVVFQQPLTKNVSLRETIAPLAYQGEDRVIGAKTFLGIRIKKFTIEAGAIIYPYGIPNYLRKEGVSQGDLTNVFFGITYAFGKKPFW